jgi:hypothetical protein
MNTTLSQLELKKNKRQLFVQHVVHFIVKTGKSVTRPDKNYMQHAVLYGMSNQLFCYSSHALLIVYIQVLLTYRLLEMC